MGYAGYVPAKLPPGRPSAVQIALWEISNTATLELFSKLLRNAAVSPSDEKFRRVKLSNARIKSLVVDENGALNALLLLGWERDPADDKALVIRKGTYFTMAEVRLVQDAQERLAKAAREGRRAGAAAKLPASAEQQRLRDQMQLDRLERSANAAS